MHQTRYSSSGKNDWVRTKNEDDDETKGKGECGTEEAFVFREAAKVAG